MTSRPVVLLATGGTIDKLYSVRGSLEIGAPAASVLLREARTDVVSIVDSVVAKDSLDLDEADRDALLTRIVEVAPAAVVVTHGTDTMAETAEMLFRDQRLRPRTVVLTGALQPAVSRESDAPFNLGAAVTAAQLLGPGVYVAMSGGVFAAGRVQKDPETGRFVGRRVLGR